MDRHSTTPQDRCWCFLSKHTDIHTSEKEKRCGCFSKSACRYIGLGFAASVTWLYFILMIGFAIKHDVFFNKEDISYFEITFPTVSMSVYIVSKAISIGYKRSGAAYSLNKFQLKIQLSENMASHWKCIYILIQFILIILFLMLILSNLISVYFYFLFLLF